MASSPHPQRRTRLLALLALALPCLALLGSPAAAAPATPAGPLLAVSAEAGYHIAPDVAATPAGALVVWHGEVAGPSGVDMQIFARRYSPAGVPRGPAFVVNATAAGQQRRPAVAAGADGSFVVAWDTDTRLVRARLIGADGSPAGADIAVSQSGAIHRDPDVAVAADGTFVVAWQRAAGGDDDVVLRRFDADGTPLGAELAPHPSATDTTIQMNPAIAALPGGAYALAWEEPGAASALQLIRLDAAAAPIGAPALVAASTAEELRDPALAAAPSGFVVAWSTYTAASRGVAARSYSAAGSPRGPAAPVAPADAAERYVPAVALAADGSAVVAWTDTSPHDGAPAGVAARRLDAAGAAQGAPFYPRPAALGPGQASSVAASIAAGAAAPLWVAWAQPPPGGPDTLIAVYARRVVERLFEVALPLVRR